MDFFSILLFVVSLQVVNLELGPVVELTVALLAAQQQLLVTCRTTLLLYVGYSCTSSQQIKRIPQAGVQLSCELLKRGSIPNKIQLLTFS